MANTTIVRTKTSRTKTTQKVASKGNRSRATLGKSLAKPKGNKLKALAKAVNELTPEELQTLFQKHFGATLAETWKMYDGPGVKSNADLQKQIWDLFEHNMRDLYIQANDEHLKWDPASKRKELYHKLSRFIVLEIDSKVEAFCMLRFEAEKNYDGDMEFVIYIYEIQVSESMRGKGICRRVFTALEKLGAELKVQIIMLTCFQCNTKALPVYTALGYKEHIDTTDTAVVFCKELQ